MSNHLDKDSSPHAPDSPPARRKTTLAPAGDPCLHPTFLLPPVLVLATAIGNVWTHTFPLVLCLSFLLAGWLSWTFVEYLLHRWVFHRDVAALQFMTKHHIIHHGDPSNALQSAPFYAHYLIVLFGIPFGAMTRSFWPTLWMLAGVILGYCQYEITHCLVHSRFRGGRVLRALRRHHLRHHDDSHHSFGVSSPLWDLLAGTLPAKRARPR